MNAKQATKVQAYLRLAADRFHLKDWDIALDLEDEPAEDEDARVWKKDCRVATVGLSRKFFRYSPAAQRRIIAHELCHLHLSRMSDTADAAAEAMDTPAFKVFHKAYSDSEEQAVESLARLLAPSLPLPRFK